MVDLEYIAAKALEDPNADALKLIAAQYKFAKNYDDDTALKFAKQVISEVLSSRRRSKDHLVDRLMSTLPSGVKAGEAGMGSRGSGDFTIHTMIAKLAHSANIHSKIPVILDPADHDDAGAVLYGSTVVYAAVDGAHSRLSSFPFLMGFHDARAALRDVCVKGSQPVALVDDVHLADDGDVAKVFEFVAGVSAVAEATGVPLVSGSTLRVGGDMVLGDRLVGAVCAVGVSKKGPVNQRSMLKQGDAVLMTEGAGGGTVAATAIYSGRPHVVKETLNIDFYHASQILGDRKKLPDVHCITDVTNGGIRGDLQSIAESSRVKIILDNDSVFSMIRRPVLEMLEQLKIDPLGLALDSLMGFMPPEQAFKAQDMLTAAGIRSAIVGKVEKGRGCYLVGKRGSAIRLLPKFRESAYTGLKKLVEESSPRTFDSLDDRLTKALAESMSKKKAVLEYLNSHK
ncbi:MAG: AIR synthase-related protein [Thermoprotei archaeon]